MVCQVHKIHLFSIWIHVYIRNDEITGIRGPPPETGCELIAGTEGLG